LILTVTPNAAIDKTYQVEDFCLDRVHRPLSIRAVAGGKGINVARVYQALGGTALTTGFLGGSNGRFIAQGLEREGIAGDFVWIRGESRLCIAIVDPKRGTQTEINEPGPEVSARAVRRLRRHVESLLARQHFDFLVLNGSLPVNVPETLYADLIEVARRTGTPAALDASGAALQAGLRARPWLVKPNRFELERVLGRPLPTEAQIMEAARALHADGIPVVAITQGREGAILVTDAGAWCAEPPPIQAINPVASGDSFLAAFLWAWAREERPGDAAYALQMGVGAGAANAATLNAATCSRVAIEELASRTIVRRLGDKGPM